MFDKYIVHDDGTVLSIIRLLKKVHKEESILLNNYDNDLRRDTESLLASSLISVAVNICGLKDQQRSSIIMVELLKYLHLNFRRDIHIPDLSRMLLCSQKTLSDQFKRIFGMTIRAYINHLRAIDVMTNIRENKDMSLYEATEISGFGSVQNMLRAYKKEFGCTPKESKVNQGK